MSGILVWIESFDGNASSSSWEALAAAKGLISQGVAGPIVALVAGKNAGEIAKQAGQYGADKVLICEDESLNRFRLNAFAALLTEAIKSSDAKIVLAVSSGAARELFASSAMDLGAGMVTEAIGLKADGESLIVTRPAYAGKVLSQVKIKSDVKFVTLRGRTFVPEAPNASAAPDISSIAAPLSEDQIGVTVESFESEAGSVKLTDAAIIISGGRGMTNNPTAAPADAADAGIWKAQEGFEKVIQPLADVLGAAVGASRAAVDAGYISYEHQVGQTGKNVNPDLYIACGISGAIQHLAGMRNSKVIVAINKDAEAPIFKLASYGIVGDLYEVVPALTEALKKRLS